MDKKVLTGFFVCDLICNNTQHSEIHLINWLKQSVDRILCLCEYMQHSEIK